MTCHARREFSATFSQFQVYWNVTQAKQMTSLLLLNNFYRVTSYRRVEKKRKATNHCIRFGHSLWSANQLPAQGVWSLNKSQIALLDLLRQKRDYNPNKIIIKEKKKKWKPKKIPITRTWSGMITRLYVSRQERRGTVDFHEPRNERGNTKEERTRRVSGRHSRHGNFRRRPKLSSRSRVATPLEVSDSKNPKGKVFGAGWIGSSLCDVMKGTRGDRGRGRGRGREVMSCGVSRTGAKWSAK